MRARPKVLAPQLEPGFMRNGFFAWPMEKIVCPGYVRRGVPFPCGQIFLTSSNTIRCQECRKMHKREYSRLYKGGVN